MEYCFELKAERGLDVNPGDYFEAAILADGNVLAEGRDEFNLSTLLLPGKRVAGFGRQKSYTLSDLPAGLSPLEAAPSSTVELEAAQSLAFRISTNVILDQGLLAQYLALRVARPGSLAHEIPFSRPDVQINWESRGTFLVTVDQI